MLNFIGKLSKVKEWEKFIVYSDKEVFDEFSCLGERWGWKLLGCIGNGLRSEELEIVWIIYWEVRMRRGGEKKDDGFRGDEKLSERFFLMEELSL